MHPSMLAKRQQAAQQRIMQAASLLAEKHNVEPPVEVTQRQPDLAQMLRWEGIADFLEALTKEDFSSVATMEAKMAATVRDEALDKPGITTMAVPKPQLSYVEQSRPEAVGDPMEAPKRKPKEGKYDN